MGAPAEGRPGTHDRLYTIQSVAQWLTVTDKTVRRWITDGQLPSVRLGPRTLRVRESDVESFIEKRSIGGEDET